VSPEILAEELRKFAIQGMLYEVDSAHGISLGECGSQPFPHEARGKGRHPLWRNHGSARSLPAISDSEGKRGDTGASGTDLLGGLIVVTQALIIFTATLISSGEQLFDTGVRMLVLQSFQLAIHFPRSRVKFPATITRMKSAFKAQTEKLLVIREALSRC
jgi:hypothetical protein